MKIVRTVVTLLVLTLSAAAQQPVRASFYARKFEGRRMANGHVYRASVPSAASMTLRLGTNVRITNIHTGQQIRLVITDRGPRVSKFALDLSTAAFRALGLTPKQGWGWVTVIEER